MGDFLVVIAVWLLGIAMLAGAAALAGFGITLLTPLTMGPAFVIALGFFALLIAITSD